MNQHKDLLYRQKYATYQLNNRTFSTQNTKISARSLAISYICFQVRIVKKKRGKKPYYQLLRKIWWPPAQGLYTRNCKREKLHFLSLLTTIFKALICWKLESFRGLHPLGTSAGAVWRALGRHPYDARAMRFAHTRCATRTDFSAHPFFANPGSATVHIPLCSSKSLAPRGVDPGGAGGSCPPPQWKYWGGGDKHMVLPPPPPPPIISSTCKFIICNARIG